MRLVRYLEILLAVGLASPAFSQRSCQPPREMLPAAVNLNFAEGALDAPPPGWYLGPEWFRPPQNAFHEARTVGGTSCDAGKQCAMLRTIRDNTSQLSFLYQVIDAAQYRGKSVSFRAAVRVGPEGTVARLLVRVHRNDCSTGFRDDMGYNPITSSRWSFYEIHAPSAIDARDIEFGTQIVGPGSIWIDNISMSIIATR